MQYSKESIQNLKSEIKKHVEKQKALKNQRKTVNIVGERTMPTYEATYQHHFCRESLRTMYIAYGFMRGKTIEQMEAPNSKPYSESAVDAIILKYGEVVCN